MFSRHGKIFLKKKIWSLIACQLLPTKMFLFRLKHEHLNKKGINCYEKRNKRILLQQQLRYVSTNFFFLNKSVQNHQFWIQKSITSVPK